MRALAELLTEVVQLAANPAIFPGHWASVAELAMEHDRGRGEVSYTYSNTDYARGAYRGGDLVALELTLMTSKLPGGVGSADTNRGCVLRAVR